MVIINCCDTTKKKNLWTCEYFQKLNVIIKNDPYLLDFIDEIHHCCKTWDFIFSDISKSLLHGRLVQNNVHY
jgi:hypothetical protein